jgi:chemotaxis protein methyltransferase CheR
LTPANIITGRQQFPGRSVPPAQLLAAASSITDREFQRISRFIHEQAGIALSPNKKTLVAGRLFRRLEVVGAASYGDYLDHVESADGAAEFQVAIDLLTTNETYFWREARHFELAETLAREAAAARRGFSVWSAASSTGEEAYTLAMVFENIRVGGVALDWQIMGSDISSRVLTTARRGLYPMDRATQLPQPLLKKYCRRGTGPQAGYLLVDRSLREKVGFRPINLVENLPELPTFDMIFLRNVMIYFDNPTKAAVVNRLLTRLKPGGTLCVGLAETLNGIVPGLVGAGPGAYRRANS